MSTETSGVLKAVLAVLFFPLFFQETFVNFAWGATDEFWVMTGKRIFLVLPALAIILGCWISIACLLTVLVRQNRLAFLTNLILTWWDLGKSIVMFWGGIIKFVFTFVVAVLEFLKISVLAIWSLVQEIVFTPFRMLRGMGQNVLNSPVPWLAVFMTIFWCVVEATIFTYVMTPIVMDVFSNITGEQLTINVIRIPLFVFLLFIVLGSYAVLSNFVNSIKEKNVQSIIGIGAIEAVVLFVEVVFLYREFVDALVPWFAQYSSNFELSVGGTLGIACFVWFGIRSLSWFLFAAHGTPTILYLIQGKGVVVFGRGEPPKSRLVSISPEFIDRIKNEMEWIRTKSEDVLASLMLPPLQVVAAGINFCTLLLNSHHLFELPFKSMADVIDTKSLMNGGTRRTEPTVPSAPKPREYENVQV